MFNNPYGLISMPRLKRVQYISTVMIMAMIIFLSACGIDSKSTSPATPEDGKANVSGQIENSLGEPYSHYNLRLAEVYWQDGKGAFVLDESFSPGAMTDPDGNFTILNVPPGEYVVMIGKPNNEYKAITDSQGLLKRIIITPGETLFLGTISFDY